MHAPLNFKNPLCASAQSQQTVWSAARGYRAAAPRLPCKVAAATVAAIKKRFMTSFLLPECLNVEASKEPGTTRKWRKRGGACARSERALLIAIPTTPFRFLLTVLSLTFSLALILVRIRSLTLALILALPLPLGIVRSLPWRLFRRIPAVLALLAGHLLLCSRHRLLALCRLPAFLRLRPRLWCRRRAGSLRVCAASLRRLSARNVATLRLAGRRSLHILLPGISCARRALPFLPRLFLACWRS